MRNEERTKPTYIMLPRRLFTTWVLSYIVLFVMILASFQYTNYVDRRSNGFWCGIITLFDNTYKEAPPPPERRKLAAEFDRLHDKLHCK